jgi:hypothetical protein
MASGFECELIGALTLADGTVPFARGGSLVTGAGGDELVGPVVHPT